ncbi:hypothetical protein EW146_g5040 [Bondarzewia mesenterica]|uniref:NADP-dependent oxidoreductase domain-containing protein n=1 Tax=Bondarzewia mesenterica TaxID=1095465 RepID=A0A4S4LSQ9_9AGAM|nr:hypothetical protein EW146_g5040 [Bondarzewia mesenterica]
MQYPTDSHLEAFQLGPFTAPRLWTGLWQLSSTAWGSASAAKIRQGMARHVSHGYIAFDMVSPFAENHSSLATDRAIPDALRADHYGSAEILFGQFQESLSPSQKVIGATKWCVFKPTDPSRDIVEAAVRDRMARMRTQSVDLLQFHWQNYSDNGYMKALRHLQDLQSEGLITTLGLCNFDAIRTDEICTQLGPGSIVTNQVPVRLLPHTVYPSVIDPSKSHVDEMMLFVLQFSLIDTRVLHGMSDVCEKHNIKLLTYGSLCGGFLSDAWLDKPEPDPYSGSLTPSQRKYLDVILKVWADWQLFQTLLSVLRTIGDRHMGASVANVATRWVLDHPCVGAVLVGTRLGVSEHPDDNLNVFRFGLSQEDKDDIEAVLDRSNGRRIISLIGDVGAEYR